MDGGAAQGVLARGGGHGVETQGREYVPALIWPQSSLPPRPSGVGRYILAESCARGPGFSRAGRSVVEVGGVVGGLVAVHVVADDTVAGDVLGFGEELIGQVHGEERVEVLDKPLVAAHAGNEGGGVLRHVEAVVPALPSIKPWLLVLSGSNSFRKLPSARRGRMKPMRASYTFCQFWARFVNSCSISRRPSFAAGLSNAPVIEGVFQGFGDGGAAFVLGHVAQLHVVAQAVVPGLAGGGDAGVEGLIGVEGRVALHDGIGNYGHGVVANHAPVLVGVVAPDGQHVLGALVEMRQHRPHHVGVAGGLHQVQQRVQGPVGVPERESGVVGALGAVDVLVEAPVLAIHVLVHGGAEKGVVEGRVEVLLVGFVRRLHHDATQLLLPLGLPGPLHGVEIPARCLGPQVGQRPGRTHPG